MKEEIRKVWPDLVGQNQAAEITRISHIERGIIDREEYRIAYSHVLGTRPERYIKPEKLRIPSQIARSSHHQDDPSKKTSEREEWIKLVAPLRKRERRVIEMLYRENKTQEQVGAIEGLTYQRVQQIEKGALYKLRDFISINYGEGEKRKMSLEEQGKWNCIHILGKARINNDERTAILNELWYENQPISKAKFKSYMNHYTYPGEREEAIQRLRKDYPRYVEGRGRKTVTLVNRQLKKIKK